MLSHIVISAIAPNRPGMANEITSLVTYCGCNIIESTMKAMSNTSSLVLMAEGEWNAIAKLEHMLPNKASSMGMTIMMQRTEPGKTKAALPYRVKLITRDNPGITEGLTSFFAEQGINIQEMHSKTYPAQYADAKIGSIRMTISIPLNLAIASVRENFKEFCVKSNLDGVLEPIEQ